MRGKRSARGTCRGPAQKGVLAGQFAEALKLLDAMTVPSTKPPLSDDVLVLLGKFADDTGRRDRDDGGAGHGSRAVEQLVELSVAGLVGGESRQRVLDDSVSRRLLPGNGDEARYPVRGDCLCSRRTRRRLRSAASRPVRQRLPFCFPVPLRWACVSPPIK